jgi:hypothetical protein
MKPIGSVLDKNMRRLRPESHLTEYREYPSIVLFIACTVDTALKFCHTFTP